MEPIPFPSVKAAIVQQGYAVTFHAIFFVFISLLYYLIFDTSPVAEASAKMVFAIAAWVQLGFIAVHISLGALELFAGRIVAAIREK